VWPVGDVPHLTPGANTVTFACEGPEGPYRARAEVTLITAGEALASGK
jgi:hypothetical protein